MLGSKEIVETSLPRGKESTLDFPKAVMAFSIAKAL